MADDNEGDLFGDDDFNPADIEKHLDAMASVDKHAWPKALVELVDIIADCLKRKYSLDVDAASQQASDIALTIGNYFGGRQTYIPCGADLKRALRDKQIYQEWKGNNVEELVARHKLTYKSIYTIIATQRRLHVRRIQPSLF